MIWHYVCPECGEWRRVEWADRNNSYICHKDTTKSYVPPTPKEQTAAYVDTHEWPQEIEDAVVYFKGLECTVPGCYHKAETLDHRVAWNNGGKTSVNNLFPMCNSHNQSKSDKVYEEWLRTI